MSHSRIVKKKWIGGCEEKMPSNLGKYDAIKCKKISMIKGSYYMETCDKIMTIKRLHATGLQIRCGTSSCTACTEHIIQSHQMYVAVCDEAENHIDGENNICCRVCIENYDYYKSKSKSTSFEIVKNCYKYKPIPKKRKK